MGIGNSKTSDGGPHMSESDKEFELETAKFLSWKNYYLKKIIELKVSEKC